MIFAGCQYVRSSSSVAIKLLRSTSRSCAFQLQLVQVAAIYALLLEVTCKCYSLPHVQFQKVVPHLCSNVL